MATVFPIHVSRFTSASPLSADPASVTPIAIAPPLLDQVAAQVGYRRRDGFEIPVIMEQDERVFHGDARDEAVIAAARRFTGPAAQKRYIRAASMWELTASLGE